MNRIYKSIRKNANGIIISSFVGLSCIRPVPPEPADQMAGRALKQMAVMNQVQADGLSIGQSTIAEYPVLGIRTFAYKGIHLETGTIYDAALDEEGREVELEELDREEAQAYAAQYGALDIDLADYLNQVADQMPVHVSIWLKQPPYEPEQRPLLDADITPEGVNAFLLREAERRSAFVKEMTVPFAQRLGELGINADADELVPVVFAEITSDALAELARWDDIERIYRSHPPEPFIRNSGDAINVYLLHKQKVTGQIQAIRYNPPGVKVAMLDVEGVPVLRNPFLSNISFAPGTDRRESPHATEVASVLVSRHPDLPGMAPDIDLMAAAPSVSWLCIQKNYIQNFVAWGARVFNLSFGSTADKRIGDEDKYYDEIVLRYYPTIVAGAGNGNDNFIIGSPAKGYNVISVGACALEQRSNQTKIDGIWEFSSYVDPVTKFTDREKPELVAPGFPITTLWADTPWFDSNRFTMGTSYSTPMVVATAALVISLDTKLGTWPEAVKAILMASAIHNVEGSSRLSSKDGAGMIDACSAGAIVTHGGTFGYGVETGDYGIGLYACDSPKTLQLTEMNLTAGKRVRAVISWMQNTRYSDYTLQPSADLDLIISDASGKTIASSLTYGANFEIVEFNPPRNGVYRMKMVRFRCDLLPYSYGWAWWQGPAS